MVKCLIGLTGGVATGKSTAASIFKELGVSVLDTDGIAHELLKKDGPEYRKVLKIFGPQALAKGGRLDRHKIARLVFERGGRAERLRKKLERVLHPAIWREVTRRYGRLKKGFMLVEVPLLFEAGFDKKVDYRMVVRCSPKVQRKRCEPAFKGRSFFQMPLSKKIKRADFVIDTSKGRGNTRGQIKKIMKLLFQKHLV